MITGDPAESAAATLAVPDGLLIALALTALLGYLSLLNAFERDLSQLRALVASIVVPLAVAFVAVLAFEALSVLPYTIPGA